MISDSFSAALSLARFGLYPVRLHFPIFKDGGLSCSCGKPKCGNSIGKHPVNNEWGKSASTDEEVIHDQFKNANWNVGIVLGICTGIPADQAIIDIEDDSDEGRELAEVLLGEYPTPSYSSGKSIHRIYRWNENLPDQANITINGLEFRFGGGGKQTQSVAPPSRHQSGTQYKWLDGMSLEDLPIAEIPQHVIEFIGEEVARRAQNSPTGTSSTDARKFRSPRGKIGPGARHHSLLIEANNLWRNAFKIWGINGLEEQDVIDQVWMWLAGANLLVCDPPKTEQEVAVIFKSSQSFMYKEILKEIDENNAKLQEMTDPEPADEDDTFGGWLHKNGIRMRLDKSLSHDEESPERIDEWICDWRMEYLTEGDEELMCVHYEGGQSKMRHGEFEKPELFARRMQQDTKGEISLQRTFAFWNWNMIWNGKPNDRKGAKGITRGLKEFLLNKAAVVEYKQQDLAEQIEDLTLMLAGNLGAIESGLQQWRDSPVKQDFNCRLKADGRGGLCTVNLPEDPITGWYLIDDSICLMVKMDELNRKYRGSYGTGVPNRLITEALLGPKLNFERRKFSHGHLAGRWFVREVNKLNE